MEDDFATQPSTQLMPEKREPMPIDSQCLLVIHPASPAANMAAMYLADRHSNYVIRNTGTYPDLCLRWDVAPKNPELGYTFGRNPVKCDVPLGQQSASRRVSNLHFRIFLNEANVVMIEDMSTNGTWVDDVCLGLPRAHDPTPTTPFSRRRSLTNGSMILLALGPVEDELKFVVDMRDINVAGWRKVMNPAARNPMAMGPPAFIGNHKENKMLENSREPSDPFALPDCWSGKDGVYDVAHGFIGKGAFAVVKKVTKKDTGEPFAIKIINKKIFSADSGKRNGETRQKGVMKEVDIMQKLTHENIVRFYEWQDNHKQLFIRMEFIAYGDLSDYLKIYGPPPESMMQEISRQLVNALAYVHLLGITHRDIKPENILIKSMSPIVVKLSDFGLAKKTIGDDTFLKTFCGTMLYLAPEVFPAVVGSTGAKTTRVKRESKKYSQACDMWSLGCVIYYMLTNVPPFQGENQEQIQARITSGNWDRQRLINKGISEQAMDFLAKLMLVDPEKRMKEVEAKRHPWLYVESGPNSSMAAPIPEEDEEEEQLKDEKLVEIREDIEEWEEIKDQCVEEEREEYIEASQALAASQQQQQAKEEEEEEEEAETDNKDEEPEPHFLEIPLPIIADADGDVEIENSQEQHTRLEREKQRVEPNLTLAQKRRPYPLPQSPKVQSSAAEKSLLSPAPSDHGSDDGQDDDDQLYTKGLSKYVDESARAYSPGPELSDRGSSDIFGNDDIVSPGLDVAMHYDPIQHSSEIHPSVTSSRGEPFQYDSYITSGPQILPASNRGIRPGRRTPGLDNGKSLAGMRTMVGNLNVANSESLILHKKGSGLMSTDDRVSKKKKSNSSMTTSRAALDAAVYTDQGDEHVTTNKSMVKARLQTISSAEGESKDSRDGKSLPPSREISVAPPARITVQQNFSTGKCEVWGRLVPTIESVQHPIIPLNKELVSYGRSSACAYTVTDARVSKQHFAITLVMPGASPGAATATNFVPKPVMSAWAKINGSNGVFINGERYYCGEIIRVFDDDVLVIFKDKDFHLGFKLEITIGKRTRTEEDFVWLDNYMKGRDPAVVQERARNIQQARLRKSDQPMSGV